MKYVIERKMKKNLLHLIDETYLAHVGLALADIHVDKFRAFDTEKRGFALRRHGTCQQRLACRVQKNSRHDKNRVVALMHEDTVKKKN